MKCYIEITLLPGADVTLYFLWTKVYQQLHLALVEIQDAHHTVNIGVAFPEYDDEQHQLGCKLRVLAPSAKSLEAVKIEAWLARFSDYLHITKIRDIPDRVNGHACFKRIQPKSSNERLARRKAKREGVSRSAALTYFQTRKEVYSLAPFIRMKSHSTGRQYRLMIVRVDNEENQGAKFSTYGLSGVSTVPLF